MSFIAELVYEYPHSLDENTQKITDEYILSGFKGNKEVLLNNTQHYQDIKNFVSQLHLGDFIFARFALS